jgi:hypothetical protein
VARSTYNADPPLSGLTMLACVLPTAKPLALRRRLLNRRLLQVDQRYIFEREFRLLRKSRHGHLQNQTRGSLLGSLYYDNITTLATLPSGGRPRHSRRLPCGGVAGCEAQRRGDAQWWGRHATPQPEHTSSRWCTGCGGRRRHGGDKTPLCAPNSQGAQSNRLPACWRGSRSSARTRHGYGPR